MVPPLSATLRCASMSVTTGFGVASSNSSELARSSPSTSRANSMTAICRPRQMPKKGIFRSRAWRTARILPSVPRTPKPPGTRMASTASSAERSPSSSREASMNSSFTWQSLAMPPWTSASFRLL